MTKMLKLSTVKAYSILATFSVRPLLRLSSYHPPPPPHLYFAVLREALSSYYKISSRPTTYTPPPFYIRRYPCILPNTWYKPGGIEELRRRAIDPPPFPGFLYQSLATASSPKKRLPKIWTITSPVGIVKCGGCAGQMLWLTSQFV